MDFYTQLTYEKPPFLFSYETPVLLMGSCFVEDMGTRMAGLKFRTDINPFGTLYNPASISHALRRLMRPEPYQEKDLFSSGGMFHSFDHHSRFSAPAAEACLRQINTRLESSARFLRHSRRLIVTWGTSWVYREKETGRIVGNCHKLPDRNFIRRRLTVEEMVDDWKSLLQELTGMNPELKVLFTVSPIRHRKDGAHGNQLGKAALLLAIDELERSFPGQTSYFPAYEIMMDELRDYRFYADDMVHPSDRAVEYIWEQFVANEVDAESQSILKDCLEIQKAMAHKPFNPDSEAYREFILQTLLKIDRLNRKMIFFDYSKERNILRSKLKQGWNTQYET